MQPKPQRTTQDHCASACFFFFLVIGTIFVFQYYATGTSTTITGAATYEENQEAASTENIQIGVYRITPSFSLPNNKNIVAEYETLQRDVRDFYDATMDCRTVEGLDFCIEETLEKEEYTGWLFGDACETKEEALFYDVTEAFSQCAQSLDSDCICVTSFDDTTRYPDGEQSISLVQDETAAVFFLEENSVSIPLIQIYSQGTLLVSADYLFSITSGQALASFSGLEPSSSLFLYKESEHVISVEDQTTFSTYSATRSACALAEETLRKFCVQSEKTVHVYSEEQGKTVEQPIVYLFAIDFE